MRFALLLASRNNLPSATVETARNGVKQAVEKEGHSILEMDSSLTRNGSVETLQEAKNFAKFLQLSEGEYDGVIVSVLNFGEESAAAFALSGCKTPILLHAISDEIGKMGITTRRDAYCGKLAFMAVFNQFGIPFTAYQPHSTDYHGEDFAAQIRDFADVCRIVNGMRRCRVGTIGSRITSFKTVRVDEITLQKYGITNETFDLTEVILRVNNLKGDDPKVEEKKQQLASFADFTHLPTDKMETLSKLAVALDDIVTTNALNCFSLRCWTELQRLLGVSACTLTSEFSCRGIPVACEGDTINAIALYAVQLATGNPTVCLDWNNNYNQQLDRCVISHCGNVPPCYLKGKHSVEEHTKFKSRMGENCAWGVINGFMAPMRITYGGAMTNDGKLSFYFGEGDITDDQLGPEFYGSGGVLKIDNLQDVLVGIGKSGFHHHINLAKGSGVKALKEAITTYLGYGLTIF